MISKNLLVPLVFSLLSLSLIVDKASASSYSEFDDSIEYRTVRLKECQYNMSNRIRYCSYKEVIIPFRRAAVPKVQTHSYYRFENHSQEKPRVVQKRKTTYVQNNYYLDQQYAFPTYDYMGSY